MDRFKKKGFTREDFFLRNKHQNPEIYKQEADFIIDNNSSMENLRIQAENLYNKINTI